MVEKIRKAAFGILCCLALGAAVDAAPVFSLIPPGGAISGTAGSTIGWGFSLSNTVDFDLITSSNFCLDSSGVANACVAPTLGVYTDFIAANGTLVGPAPEQPVIVEPFNNAAHTGVGSFTIFASALVGASDVGQIVLTYDEFSRSPNDPNFNPDTDTLSSGNFLTSPASVTVIAANAVPEPASVSLAGTALAFLGFAGWKRRRT